MQEKERTELLYNSKLSFLKKEISYLLDDEAVQLYLFLQKEIDITKEDKQKALDKQLKKHQENCQHPIFVCLNEDEDNTEYDCMCLSCQKHLALSYEEVKKLYNDQRIIAIKKENSKTHKPVYVYSNEFVDAKKYYLNLYDSIDAIIQKSFQEEILIDEYICDETFKHFVKPAKAKKLEKHL